MTGHARPTPHQSLGPFYPSIIPPDSDADLTFVQGRNGRAQGHLTTLRGQVLSVNGGIVPQARIELWQCDAFGSYHHPMDGGGIDPFFQGYGRVTADNEGRYRFKTIKPVAYPGRAPHIHLRVTTNSDELITQIYVLGNRENRSDFLLNAVPNDKARRSLVIPFIKDPSGNSDELVANFNPVIG